MVTVTPLTSLPVILGDNPARHCSDEIAQSGQRIGAASTIFQKYQGELDTQEEGLAAFHRDLADMLKANPSEERALLRRPAPASSS